MAKKQSEDDDKVMKMFREQFLNGTNHYCPECGEKAKVIDPEYSENIDPVAMTVVCDKCGSFRIERKNGLYFWNDIPYIPGMENNSATLLYRRDPKAPLQTEDDYFELSGLMMDVSDGYKDNFNFVQHIEMEKRLIDLVKESIGKGYKGLTQIPTISYSRLAQYHHENEDNDLARQTVIEGLEYSKTLGPLNECAYIYMCIQNDVFEIAKDAIEVTYLEMKSADLDKIDKESDERFASAVFLNILAGISDAFGKDDDYRELIKRSLDRFIELYDGTELSDEEFDTICSEYYQNITVMEDPKALCEEFIEFTKDREDKLWYCNALLRRYIAHFDDDEDFTGDLDVIIDGLADKDDLDGRYCRANALLFRSSDKTDKKKMIRDLSLAFDLMIANLQDGDEIDDLAKSVIISYLSEIRRADSKRYDASVKTLKELGISKGDVKRWTEEFTHNQ